MPRSERAGEADGDPVREAQRLAEVERVRSEHLEAQIALLENRLAATERHGAGSGALLAERERELSRLRADSELVVARATAPLRAAERAIRWLASKLGRVGSLLGRRVVFRSRSRD